MGFFVELIILLGTKNIADAHNTFDLDIIELGLHVVDLSLNVLDLALIYLGLL